MIAKYRANDQAEGYSNMLIKSLMENKGKKKRKKKPFFASREWKLHAVVHMVYACLQP